MNRTLLIALFLLIALTGFAQKGKDTVVYNLPVVNGKLIYTDSIAVKDHNKAVLDSAAKKWFIGYFKYYKIDTSSYDKTNIIAHQGRLEYTIKPGLINIPYYAIITIHISCNNGYYSYRIYNIYFAPQGDFFKAIRVGNVIGYENDPEHLIVLYKQKHIGFLRSMTIDRGEIRNYLFNMNLAVRNCIASLNKAMAN